MLTEEGVVWLRESAVCGRGRDGEKALGEWVGVGDGDGEGRGQWRGEWEWKGRKERDRNEYGCLGVWRKRRRKKKKNERRRAEGMGVWGGSMDPCRNPGLGWSRPADPHLLSIPQFPISCFPSSIASSVSTIFTSCPQKLLLPRRRLLLRRAMPRFISFRLKSTS